MVSGDDNLPEKDDLGERRRRHETFTYGKLQCPDEISDEKLNDDPEGSEDEELTIPSLEEELDGKQHIHISGQCDCIQMEKNKGVTPHRKKLTKNPRKKYKLKHQKAVICRKGQVRDVRTPHGPYGGETT
ncbi:hypothetical protein KI387_022030, partial [Taxus chinensis]